MLTEDDDRRQPYSNGVSNSTTAMLHAVGKREIAGAALARHFSVYALAGYAKHVVASVEDLITAND
jgi:hypothetical protein